MSSNPKGPEEEDPRRTPTGKDFDEESLHDDERRQGEEELWGPQEASIYEPHDPRLPSMEEEVGQEASPTTGYPERSLGYHEEYQTPQESAQPTPRQRSKGNSTQGITDLIEDIKKREAIRDAQQEEYKQKQIQKQQSRQEALDIVNNLDDEHYQIMKESLEAAFAAREKGKSPEKPPKKEPKTPTKP